MRTNDSLSNNHIEYEGNRDKNEILSIKEYLEEIKSYLKHINDLKEFDLCKIQLTLPVLCISESCIEKKIKLNFFFHTSLWGLKRFYEGLFVRDWDGKG